MIIEEVKYMNFEYIRKIKVAIEKDKHSLWKDILKSKYAFWRNLNSTSKSNYDSI